MKNPQILQEFERRLEGAVEGFFARAFRSGLQPVELAKGIRRYAEQQREVAADVVVVPNAYRFRINPKDADRLGGYGNRLTRELASVVEATAAEESWALAGPVVIELRADPEVDYGLFRIAGRVDANATPTEAAPAAPPADAPTVVDPAPPGLPPLITSAAAVPAPTPSPTASTPGDPDATSVDMTGAFAAVGATTLALALPGGREIPLTGTRLVAGRQSDNAIAIDDVTVSRAHAAFVKRGGQWWVLDLGSTNGTRVNGRTAAEHPVHAGDRVELGEVVVEVVER